MVTRASHSGSPVSIPGESMWNLWWTAVGRIFLRERRFSPVSITPPTPYTTVYLNNILMRRKSDDPRELLNRAMLFLVSVSTEYESTFMRALFSVIKRLKATAKLKSKTVPVMHIKNVATEALLTYSFTFFVLTAL